MEAAVAPIRCGELVYAEIYNIRTGHYESVHALVKGKRRVGFAASEEAPWRLVVELRCDVGTTYFAEDVVSMEPWLVSRTPSEAIMPVPSEFTEAHLKGLPEVRVRRYRIVGTGS